MAAQKAVVDAIPQKTLEYLGALSLHMVRAGEAAIAGQGPQPVCQMPEVRAAWGGGAIWRVHRSGSEWLLQSPAADPVIDDSAECE